MPLNSRGAGPEITCFGQNIARGNQGFKGALLSWASEKKAFVYGQKPQCPLQETGHYAVQVYAEVAIMGCGFTDKCSGVRTFICHHCLYSTDYIPGTCSPYLEGTPANGGVCGQCGGLGSNRCPNGLCKVECPLPGADPAQRQACNKFFWENPGVCENGIAKSKKPECKESCDCLQ
ncbi:hypothetical protein BV898_08196 [Hypsibius exemplaris]|uniref:Uncharacterized protein n=1 Tax=Hypsibius exemplaris TaxID=2072580 RepID=A0A1W0WRC5_HYPEX|nr:hypothetical protein BV898_08196 [Hypsibius exemplaris]